MKKKIVCFVTLICFIVSGPAVRPANAWVPLLFTGVFNAASLASWIELSAWVHAAGAATYMWYHSRGTKKSTVDANGNITRDGQVTWIDLKDGKPVGKTAQIGIKIPYDKMMEILNAPGNDLKYPLLFHAFKKDNTKDLRTITGDEAKNLKAGDKVYCHDGIIRKIAKTELLGPGYYTTKESMTFSGYPAGSCTSCTPPYTITGSITTGTWPPPETRAQFMIKVMYDDRDLAEEPDLTDRSTSEAGNKLANEPETNPFVLPKDVYSDRYGQEIDDFIMDNPNVFTPVDPETGKNLNPPSAPPRSTIDSAGGGGASPSSGSRNPSGGVGSPGYPPSPFYQDSDGDGVPDDGDGDGTPDGVGGTEEDEDDALQVPGDNTYDSDVENPEKKEIGSLLDNILSSSPLLTMIRGITIDGSSPESTFHFNVYGQEIAIDFSQWASIMAGCGTAFLAVSHVGAIFLIFRRDD